MNRYKKIARCAAGLLVSSSTSVAWAQDNAQAPVETPSYLAILGSYTFADDERASKKLDYASGGRLLFGSTGDDGGLGYELGVFLDNYETRKLVAVDFYRSGFAADLTYSFGDRLSFTPFALIGAGAAYNDVLPNSEDDWSWQANAGLGFVTGPLTERGLIRLRAEARYMYDDFQGGYGEPRIEVGIEIPLFGPPAPPPPAPPPPAPEVVTVTKEVVVEVPTGVLDSDGDGVIDEKDKCPQTPKGDRVDGEGCTLAKIIDLKGVTFDFNQARLSENAQVILEDVVAILAKYPDMRVEIAGHTDSKGSDEYNQKLSERRAAAVRDHFISKGRPAEQMTSKGYGESEPRDTNDTEEGRERNRRVELRILN